jgi:cardiolipin synthase A/B
MLPSLRFRDLIGLLPLSELLSVVSFLFALVFLAQILRSRRPPQSTIAWLLTILLVPYLGVPLYLMFGGRKMNRLARRKTPIYSGRQEPFQEPEPGGGTERLLRTFGVPPSTVGNTVRLISNGEDAFREIARLIDQAHDSIHITTYILSDDLVGLDVINRLTRRAREGVTVRVLYDDVGSWRLKRRVLQPLIQAGGEVAGFMPLLHVPFRGRSNLRNHRKILVADGKEALTGGMNIAEEYLGPKPSPERWVDVSLVVLGPAVTDIDAVFRSDWTFATERTFPIRNPEPDLDPEPDPDAPQVVPHGGTPVQVVASGPDVVGDPLYESLVNLIFAAKRRIWIATPYFVPDEILVRALELAARRGLDVRLVVPYRSNHVTADLARYGYLRQIHEAGAKILRYRPVMIHAKVTLIDDEVGIVGSANMDMRSLFLNYEVALFLFSPARANELVAWFDTLFPFCRPGLGRQNWAREVAENVARLIAPLL